MVRHVFSGNLGDVATDGVLPAKVGHISALGITVPLTGEHALTANSLKRQPDAAYASEQIYEFEVSVMVGHRLER